MELIWGAFFFFGLIVGVVVAIAACNAGEERYVSQGDNKRKLHRDSADDVHLPDGNGDRGGINRYDKPTRHTTEEMIQVLQVLRLSACRYERENLNDIIDILAKGDDGK